MHSTTVGLLSILCLFVCVAAYDDRRCTQRRGTCQMTWTSCSGGSYVSNLCGGPSNRRCCIRQAYDDRRCTQRRGTCQMTLSPCSGGSYVSNLCGGPSNRRCCIRQGGAGDRGCSAEQRRLACNLIRDRNIRAATRHPSGQTDNAYAYNNLQDMCNGRQASRSSYRCNAQCHAPGAAPVSV